MARGPLFGPPVVGPGFAAAHHRPEGGRAADRHLPAVPQAPRNGAKGLAPAAQRRMTGPAALPLPGGDRSPGGGTAGSDARLLANRRPRAGNPVVVPWTDREGRSFASVEHVMPWVVRGKKRYFVKSVRRAGRILKEYYGSGSAAELAAARVARKKEERRRQAAARAAALTEWRAVERILNDLDRVLRA